MFPAQLTLWLGTVQGRALFPQLESVTIWVPTAGWRPLPLGHPGAHTWRLRHPPAPGVQTGRGCAPLWLALGPLGTHGAPLPRRRERSKVPYIVRQCVEEIERRGMEEVGIYRVSGVATDIQALKAAFDVSEWRPGRRGAGVGAGCPCFPRAPSRPVLLSRSALSRP